MIKVKWPLKGSDKDEDDVFNWLEDLVQREKGTLIFVLSEDCQEIFFAREDDAIAFKLRFGL